MGACCGKKTLNSSWLDTEGPRPSHSAGRELFDDWEKTISQYESLEREYLAHHTAQQLTDVLSVGVSGGHDEDKLIQDLRAAHRRVLQAESTFKLMHHGLNNIEMDGKLPGSTGQYQAEAIEEGSTGLTQTLVNRLRAVSSAQGTIVGGKIKQKWPEWLVDESFEVIKVRLGVNYNRTLKLTQYHILAASSDRGVTKVYSYLDLYDVRVSQQAKEESIMLIFRQKEMGQTEATRGRTGPLVYYTYLTPLAALIAQQISTRLRIRKALRSYTGSTSGRHPSQGELTGIAGSSNVALLQITNENRKTKTSAILAFAEALSEKLLPNAGETSLSGERKSVSDPNRDSVLSRGNRLELSSTSCPGSPSGKRSSLTMAASDLGDTWVSAGASSTASSFSSTADSGAATSVAHLDTKVDAVEEANKAKSAEDMAERLLIIKKASPEYHVQQAVKRVVLEGPSPEQATRTHFLKTMADEMDLEEAGKCSLATVSAKLKTMRMWIEGMHEYVLMKRAPSLATIFIWSQSLSAESTPPSPLGVISTKTDGSFLDSPVSLSARRPSQATQISQKDLNDILDKHLQQQSMVDEPVSPSSSPNSLSERGESGEEDYEYNPLTALASFDRLSLVSISYVTYSVIEESVFVALKPNLFKLLLGADDLASRDQALKRKIQDNLSKMTQAEWNIPEKNRSALGWHGAIEELKSIDDHISPSHQLAAIVIAAKNIFAEYSTVMGDSADPLGADDLVPIFIYVLAQTELEHALVTKEILWNICHPSTLHGESGYYLTVFESAIAFLEDYDCEGHGPPSDTC